ncbi:glycosyltransferase family 4 protein [Epilithonimonas vandammei]|uniref:Glycosyltransferase family 1 protein n=1 Tax=Epilithonimonas vandammei TaxID=2487072 RepID=A0A3G8ZH67_9FLAO|nr:glycosyltransferase family 1 protein [Epilithonimonas vandammei]AZI39613.1 glycosyltransferase family 1 protein [Epilithonimonas vandammei]AZI56568.1 glycosyltransferase family 1 protein [Epilithonimonas vandammei]
MIIVNSRFLTQPITGVQRFAIEISLQLKKLFGNDIRFISPHNILQKEIAEKLEVEIVGKRSGHLWEQLDLPRFLKSKDSPLLINLTNTAPLFYKNKLTTIHDVAFLVYPKAYSKIFYYSYKVFIPKIIAGSKKVVTVSEFSKSEIYKYYPKINKNIEVVYNAVSNIFERFDKNINDKENNFLAVSSINQRKNFSLILKSFSLIKNEYPNYKLFIIGDINNSNFGDTDLSLYLKDENIKFLGRVSDESLVDYYSKALAFIYPSFYEGFGIPPLEAQACGCPVILAKTSSLPEVFKDSGLYCDPHSEIELKNIMIELIKNQKLRIELSEKGYKNADRFSWKKSGVAFKNIIDSL